MRLGDEHAKSDVESGVYERHYRMKEGDVVLDIGAHVGYFTELAAERVGPGGWVIAFEPEPENFNLLLDRVGVRKNVCLINAAALDQTGRGKLYLNSGNSGGHSLCGSSGFVKVNCVRASEFVWGKPVRFVKLDAEGSELEILRDLVPVLASPVDIAFEAHSAQLYRDCKELLVKAGYEFLPVTEHVGVCYAWL